MIAMWAYTGCRGFAGSRSNYCQSHIPNTGAVAPPLGAQNSVPAFYSAAFVPREKYTLWLFAAIYGQVHLVDGMRDQVAAKLGWGSDIATVHSTCGSGWQVLANTSSNAAIDTVQAFEFPDREAITASQAADFN